VVSFTPRPLYPQGKSTWYSLDRMLGGPQSRSGRDGEEKNSQPSPGIEPWNLDHPGRSPALHRLSYHGSIPRKFTSKCKSQPTARPSKKNVMNLMRENWARNTFETNPIMKATFLVCDKTYRLKYFFLWEQAGSIYKDFVFYFLCSNDRERGRYRRSSTVTSATQEETFCC
jgi:hypothetical protein